MIIWRGWGIIGFGLTALGAILGMGLWSAFGSPGEPTAFLGLGIALSGVPTFLIGRHMNETSVAAKAEKLLAPRRQQLDYLVSSGQFQVAPGYPAPSSEAEARAQANGLYEGESMQVRDALKNRHTLFFIPFQWIGALAVLIGVPVAIVGLLNF